MDVKFGAFEKISSTDFAASITAVAAPCVALLWHTPFVTVFHLKIS